VFPVSASGSPIFLLQGLHSSHDDGEGEIRLIGLASGYPRLDTLTALPKQGSYQKAYFLAELVNIVLNDMSLTPISE
jgi:hypothetical protein